MPHDMRFPFLSRARTGPRGRIDTERILAQYVLNMSITCLGDEDVTPLYEEYMKDARLGETQRADLTEIYRSLFPGPTSTAAKKGRAVLA